MSIILGLGLQANGAAFSVEPESQITLTRAVSENANGLSRTGLTDQQVEKLRADARRFIEFRRHKRGQQQIAWVASCGKDPTDIYCSYLNDRAFRDGGSAKKRNKSRAILRKIHTEVNKGHVPHVEGAGFLEYAKVLRFSQKKEKFVALSNLLLKDETCANPVFAAAMGQKAEEYFPDEAMQDLSMKLYERSLACGNHEAMSKVRYRLGLMYVWKGRYADADKTLEPVSNEKGGEYTSRALYWRNQSLLAQREDKKARVLQERLLQEYPLSYHTLLLNHGISEEMQAFFKRPEPMVKFASKSSETLNQKLRGIEMLQEEGASDLALDLLEDAMDEVSTAEREVKVYVALLLQRSQDTLRRFKLLATMFREDPSILSRPILELYYPLRKFDAVRAASESNSFDPMMTAAIIRQESAFNDRARSGAGAMGLMQLMPLTARRLERVSRRELYDPKTNVRIGVKFFKKLLERFDQDPEMALAAYNAGPERVDEWKKRYTMSNRVLFMDFIPFQETREYVASIGRNYYWYLSLYSDEGVPSSTQSATRAVASERPGAVMNFTVFSNKDKRTL